MKNIDKYLRKYKVTLAELGRRADIKYTSIKKYRYNGLNESMTLEMAMRIAKALNISVEQLYQDILNEE